MKEWIKCKIKDIGQVASGGTPSTKVVGNYQNGTIPWITPKDLAVLNNRHIKKGETFITEEGLNSSSARLLPSRTILFTSRAPIGYVAIADNTMCTNQGFKSIIPNDNKIDYLFLFYLLKNNYKLFVNMGSGTTFKEISTDVMKNIDVYIPKDIEYQKKISSLLNLIDSKIELNVSINDNLFYCNLTIHEQW